MNDTPIKTATPAELAGKAEENMLALARDMAAALGGQWEDTGALIRYHTAPPNAMFKGVLRPRLPAGDVDAAIQETIGWFEARRASYFYWWVDDDAQPASLGTRLEAHGLILTEKNARVMAADIARLNWRNPRPGGLRLEPAAGDQQLSQWKDVFAAAFAVPESAGQAWVDAVRLSAIEPAPWTLLLGTLDGTPVCCGILYCGAGVAGLVGLGTLPAYRRLGIGSAMQLERLRLARLMGYRYAVLFAGDQGYSAYARLGFHDTRRTVSRYLWWSG